MTMAFARPTILLLASLYGLQIARGAEITISMPDMWDSIYIGTSGIILFFMIIIIVIIIFMIYHHPSAAPTRNSFFLRHQQRTQHNMRQRCSRSLVFRSMYPACIYVCVTTVFWHVSLREHVVNPTPSLNIFVMPSFSFFSSSTAWRSSTILYIM